jgi:acyl transferase domain-containing protein
LRIGSVKANIGHLESAAGIAGLIKIILAMQHRTLPPQPNYHQPNPHIPWSNIAIQVNQTATEWQGEMLAGISSFGMSGTNVHMILVGGEVAAPIAAPQESTHNLLCLSAKSQNALIAQINQHIDHLQTMPSLDQPGEFSRFCRACLTQRSHFNYRFSVVVRDRADAITQLQQAIHRDRDHQIQAEPISQSDITQFQNQNATPEVLQHLSLAYMSLSQLDDQAIDWSTILPSPQPRIPLPEYPFQKQHYWVDLVSRLEPNANADVNDANIHPLLGDRLKLAQTQTHYFTQSFSLETLPYLADHVVAGRAIFPTSGFIELFWAGLSQISLSAYQLTDLTIHQPLIIIEQAIQLQTVFTPDDTGNFRGEIFRYDADRDHWICHASTQAQKITPQTTPINLDLYRKDCPNLLDISGYYQQCSQVGLDYGQRFQSLKSLAQGNHCAIAEVILSAVVLNAGVLTTSDHHQYCLHPILLDGCLQAIGALCRLVVTRWFAINLPKNLPSTQLSNSLHLNQA